MGSGGAAGEGGRGAAGEGGRGGADNGGRGSSSIGDSPAGSGGVAVDAAGGVGGAGAEDAGGSAAGADADASGNAGGPDAAPPAQNFTCTLILGAFQTSQWFDAGFETAVGTARWEIKSAHNNWTEKWADPNNAIWNLPTASPCTARAATPDRVLLIVYKDMFGPPIAPTVWEPEITKDVENIKTKYPAVRQIELLTLARAPNNQPCPGNSSRNIAIAPEIDAAIQSVADKSGGLVKVGPRYYVPDCSLFVMNITTLTDGGGARVAPQLIEYYNAHP